MTRESLDDLRSRLGTAAGTDRAELAGKVRFMEETDMAVVVSPAQNEVRDFREKGIDILPHRRRMIRENLETRFKTPGDPFRIVFVTAMWMTGFDVPSLSTLYLDKPMRNHTLMQAIARANRVFEGKLNGLIVDYIGVFRNLQRALAIYGSASGGGVSEGEMPVSDKGELLAALLGAIEEARSWCSARGISLAQIDAAADWEKLRRMDNAVEAILESDDSKGQFLALAARVNILYKAVLPDPAATEHARIRALLGILSEKIVRLGPPPDIGGVLEQVSRLLDRSVAAEAYVIREERAGYEADGLVDLHRIDFEALRRRFGNGRKRTEAERLKAAINARLLQMVRLNRTRSDYLERFRQLIEEYNAGSKNIEEFFEELLRFARGLDQEEQRTVAEGLSEEALAIFDLLTRPAPELSEKEKADIKKVARDLLGALKAQKLVLDWRKRQQSRADVLVTIEDYLDRALPESFTPGLYKEKCGLVYQHVYDSYYGGGKSVYDKAA